MNHLSISVTSLAQFVSRSGSLSSGSYGNVSGIEGTRLHQKIFANLKKDFGDNLSTETTLSGIYDDGYLSLSVNGRADAIISDEDKYHIIEIKSFNSTKNSFEKLVRPEHESQLVIYAYLFMSENDLSSIDITLRYVSITTLEAFDHTETITIDEAYQIFEEHAVKYLEFAWKLINYGESMIKSIKDLSFPYDNIRPGQNKLMKNVLQTLKSKEVLFALAPTGTGKTISTLYPAIKGLQLGRYDKIYYLTAKTATRSVAVKALNDLRDNGLIIRSILLSSKENMCLLNMKCDAKFCKYSDGYYSRLRPALEEALLYDDISPEICTKIAVKHNICPHEFSLDVMDYCTVVIGDYNHAFDPRVKLIRAFENEVDDRNVVLIDEAHNMVDRARTMYSASLSYTLLKDMIKAFRGRDARVERYLQVLDNYYRIIDQSMSANESAFKTTENIDERKILLTENFEGMRAIPKEFYTSLWASVRYLSPILDSLPQGELRRICLEYFFEARFFLTIIELYYNDSYITCAKRELGDITMNLVCLDSSDKICELIKDKMSVVFFSATLSPYEYYRNVIIGKDVDFVRNIELASPFPHENLDILLDTSLSTVYKDRAFTAPAIAKRILDEIKFRRGNFMVFFSSFEHMKTVSTYINEEFSKLDAEEKERNIPESDRLPHKLIMQTSGMTPQERNEFLDYFSTPNEGCLLGACVLGGHFGEGIDLVGDKLSGVIIVGVGIPKITPEREILSNYYSEKFGDGYAFAYRFPGWEKVLQAVGRVIRTEDDTGFALLIDERYDKPEYLQLFPENWRI